MHPLDAWLREQGWSKYDLAKRVDVSIGLIYMACRGQAVGLTAAMDIAALTGVPIESLASRAGVKSLRAYLSRMKPAPSADKMSGGPNAT